MIDHIYAYINSKTTRTAFLFLIFVLGLFNHFDEYIVFLDNNNISVPFLNVSKVNRFVADCTLRRIDFVIT